jgi:formamidopyrimidine-DNA glycosylase
MPELPEVEHFRRFLARHARGQRIRRLEILDRGVLRNVTPARLRRSLIGRRFLAPRRSGKWLLARTDGPIVLLHFGMTGELVWAVGDQGRHPHDRVVFVLTGGELRYRDQRKLQGLWLAADEDEARRIIGPQGPDALDLDRSSLEALLAAHAGRLKPLLMNQEAIAGLGNITTDEILWRARLHPARRARDLAATERRRLHQSMQRVLQESVHQGGIPTRRGWLSSVRDQAHPACPRCGAVLRRTRVSGRSSYWCSRCQPLSPRRRVP